MAGCASAKLVQGPYDAGAYSVTLSRPWTETLTRQPKNMRLLTVDGALLNRLHFYSGLAEGDALIYVRDRDTPRPTYRADMTESELVELVVDSLATELQAPEATNLRPQNFGAASGIRFDLAAQTSAGLDISGTALVAQADGKLNVILYLAPSEHYYGSLLQSVESAFASARIDG